MRFKIYEIAMSEIDTVVVTNRRVNVHFVFKRKNEGFNMYCSSNEETVECSEKTMISCINAHKEHEHCSVIINDMKVTSDLHIIRDKVYGIKYRDIDTFTLTNLKEGYTTNYHRITEDDFVMTRSDNDSCLPVDAYDVYKHVNKWQDKNDEFHIIDMKLK